MTTTATDTINVYCRAKEKPDVLPSSIAAPAQEGGAVNLKNTIIVVMIALVFGGAVSASAAAASPASAAKTQTLLPASALTNSAPVGFGTRFDAGLTAAARGSLRPNFQAGWDRDHYWIILTRGEVLGGLTSALCRRVLPWYGWPFCWTLGWVARQIIGGHSGVWAEAWPNSWGPWYWRVGTW